jgi:hypothetical protein
MHWMAAELQQSALVMQFSNSCAHVGTVAVHTSAPPSVPGRQKPPQHSSPLSHELPSILHGSTTQ